MMVVMLLAFTRHFHCLCAEPAMSDGSCDGDVLWNTENSLDLPLVHNRDARQHTSASKLSCVLCGAVAASAARHVKVLPCLHITCQHCLVQFLSDKSPPYKDTNFAAAIFACPCCSYTIQLPSNGVIGLKDASFLQAVDCSMTSDASESHVQWLSDSEGCEQNSTSSFNHDINCAAGDTCVKDVSLQFDNLPQSLKENYSNDINPSSVHTGSNGHVAVMSVISSVNGRERSDCDCDVIDDKGLMLLGETRSQIYGLSVDVEHRQHDCQHAVQQIKLATQELDARKVAIQNTISKRADYLCHLIHTRRDQLLDELDREHSHSASIYNERVSGLDAYRRNLEDSRLFANAVLATKYVSAEVEHDVVARLNQLVMCETHGVEAARDMPQVTAMRLAIPDAQHEESHLEKLFGSLVKGTIGSVEFLKSFNTDLHWPTGFVVTCSHDSVLVGKAGAFANEGQVLFYDSHGACVHCHTLPAGHLPIGVVTVASGDVLVSDVSGQVTKFSSSGGVVAEWSDMFQGPSGHMAVSNHDQVLVTSSGESCIHRYREVDGQRLATFSLQWPDDGLNTQPDLTAIAISSNSDIVVTASNRRNPYFFTDSGQFLHSCSSESAADQSIRTLAGNGLTSTSIALPSAMCCDSFDNVLIADFLGNCVHLVSSRGSHLGRLITNTHGIACPNFITLDQDCRLYVGQYGGDVLVFQYLSYVKHV